MTGQNGMLCPYPHILAAMKPETIRFARPVAVIEAFHHHYDYGKDRKRFDQRREAAAWQQSFRAASGYVAGSTLHLPQTIAAVPRWEHATHLTLEHFQNPDYYYFQTMPPNHCLHLSKWLVDYSMFKLKALDAGAVEIHLNWSWDGYFDHQQYKIAELREGDVLEIRLNRKADTTLSGRKERTYTEAFTKLYHLGTFGEAVLLPNPTVEKPLPETTKTVDLMRRLY